MAKVKGLWQSYWVVFVLGWSFAATQPCRLASAQGDDTPFKAPGPIRAVSGSQYAGLEYDPLRVATSRPRLGSVMPSFSQDRHPEEGTIIYESEPRLIGVQDEEMELLAPPEDGQVMYESGLPAHGLAQRGECASCEPGGCSSCGLADECTSCGTWDGCGSPDCAECVPLCLPRFRYLEVFAGVHGFTNPLDSGQQTPFSGVGNFGFQEGINISGRPPFLRHTCVNYQVGYQAVQSRLSGDDTSADERWQHFLTAGLYRRNDRGLQGGAVIDLLWDQDLLVGNRPLSQIRAEIGVVGPRGGEVGFWTAIRGNKVQIDVAGNEFAGAVDQYLFYYRANFLEGGEGRLWGGWTRSRDGVVGAELMAPLNHRWAVRGGFNYLIPRERQADGAVQESWNVGINLVWLSRRSSRNSPFQPLFNVADNGLMWTDRADLN